MRAWNEQHPGKARLIMWRGETDSMAGWARQLGINVDTLYYRLVTARWTVEKAFTHDVRANSRSGK